MYINHGSFHFMRERERDYLMTELKLSKAYNVKIFDFNWNDSKMFQGLEIT